MQFEGGGGKEKSLPPIFYPLGGHGTPKFLRAGGLGGPYLSSKPDAPPVKNGVRGRGRPFEKIFDRSFRNRAESGSMYILPLLCLPRFTQDKNI